MKRLLIICVAVLMMAGLVRSCLGLGPTTLTVNFVETNGPAVQTNLSRVLVGYVPENKRGAPTLGNIRLIKPVESTTNRYIVPPNTRIGIFAIIAGSEPIKNVVIVSSGRHLRHDFMFDQRD